MGSVDIDDDFLRRMCVDHRIVIANVEYRYEHMIAVIHAVLTSSDESKAGAGKSIPNWNQ